MVAGSGGRRSPRRPRWVTGLFFMGLLACSLAVAGYHWLSSLATRQCVPDLVALVVTGPTFAGRPRGGPPGLSHSPGGPGGVGGAIAVWDPRSNGLQWLTGLAHHESRILDLAPSGTVALASWDRSGGGMESAKVEVIVADVQRNAVTPVHTQGYRVLALNVPARRALVDSGDAPGLARLADGPAGWMSLDDVVPLDVPPTFAVRASISRSGRYAALERGHSAAEVREIIVLNTSSGRRLATVSGVEPVWDCEGPRLYYKNEQSLMRLDEPFTGAPIPLGRTTWHSRLFAVTGGYVLEGRSQFSLRYLVEEAGHAQMLSLPGLDRIASRDFPAFGVFSLCPLDRGVWEAQGQRLGHLLQQGATREGYGGKADAASGSANAGRAGRPIGATAPGT